MKVLREDINRTKKLMGLIIEGTSYNDLVAQVREVGLRSADLKTLKKEVGSDDSLTNTQRNKLTKLIDGKLDETGLNEWDDYRYLRTEDDELGGMTSDPRIMAREYGNVPVSPEVKASEKIFQLFNEEIGECIGNQDRDWASEIKGRIEVIVNTAVSESQEQDYDKELDLEESCSGVHKELDTTLDLAKQGEFFEHDDEEDDDRPDNWRELPGYNPDAFYDDDWKEIQRKYGDKKKDDENKKASILDRFKKVLYNVSDEQAAYNEKHNLPTNWRGSKEGYHEKITNKTFPSGSNE
jgi:hypothetical protein